MKPDSRERIAQETLEIYAPAGIDGWESTGLRAELEDLSFELPLPRGPRGALAQGGARGSSRDRDKYIVEVSDRLETHAGSRTDFEVGGRSGRVKHLLLDLPKDAAATTCEFEQVHDYVAFRVIASTTVADCYAALGAVHSAVDADSRAL